MISSFQDEVVLITGSTRGIGKEIARAFAQAGAVALILGRNRDLAEAVRKEFQQAGYKSDAYICDVTSGENVQETVNKILDKYNRIDILVNNAGMTKDNLLLRMKETDWDEVIRVNLRGIFNCTRVVSKVMLKAKKGKIVNISSIIGMIGNPGQSNYAASKAGIIGFTKSIARELASRGITVNAVAPGYIETDMTAQLKEQTRKEILKNIPQKKFGSPQDVAGVCLFLASKGADYITGQTIVVDGGLAI